VNEAIYCELCGHEIKGDDYRVVEIDGRLTTICGDCYAEPLEPPEWAHTPRSASYA